MGRQAGGRASRERGSEIDVRRTLPLHLTWMVGLVLTWFTVQEARRVRPGMDSHAFWGAWQGSMYDRPPNSVDAYNYSPAFAQAIWPVAAHLSWPAFGLIWSAACVAALVYLLAPLGTRWAAPLLLCCTPEIVSGNSFWLLALAAAWGLRHPACWVVPLLTKVTPALGPVWFAARGEWRRLAVSVGVTMVVVGASWLAAPDPWSAWLDFLRANLGGAAERTGSTWAPPLVVRLPVALVVVVWAARRDRAWGLPVAMALATPVSGVSALVILAALPRLNASAAGPATRTGRLVRRRPRGRARAPRHW